MVACRLSTVIPHLCLFSVLKKVRETLRRDLEDFYSTVLRVVTEACDTTVNSFLVEMQIEADHPMTFMDKAALRSKLRSLTAFMRFVDFMAVGALRALAIESVRDAAAAFSSDKNPKKPARQVLDYYMEAMEKAPVPEPQAKAKEAAAAAAKAKEGGDKKAEAVVEEKVPLRCAEGEEETPVIMSSSVRFLDDLEVRNMLLIMIYEVVFDDF